MTSSIPNVLAGRYASGAMTDLWSPEAKIVMERQLWLAVMAAQAELGLAIPAGTVMPVSPEIAWRAGNLRAGLAAQGSPRMQAARGAGGSWGRRRRVLPPVLGCSTVCALVAQCTVIILCRTPVHTLRSVSFIPPAAYLFSRLPPPTCPPARPPACSCKPKKCK